MADGPGRRVADAPGRPVADAPVRRGADAPARRPPAVAVFCGAKPGSDPRFLALARRTGALLAASGATLVYGGGHVGMMGALADAALAEGGEVVGVIPAVLMDREVGHTGLTRLEVVPDMAVRKQRMIELADAFLTLPGGLGTLDELFEVLTLRQLGEHARPIVVVDDGGYFGALCACLDEFVGHGLAAARDVAALESVPTPEAALERLGLAASRSATEPDPGAPPRPPFIRDRR